MSLRRGFPRRSSPTTETGLPVRSLLPLRCSSVLASLFAKKKSFDDAIIFNENNLPIETSNSNIFILKNNVIITPNLSQGCVDGTMRRLIIDILKKNYEVLEKNIEINDFKLAHEVFISNSITGVKWVKKVEDTVYESSKISSSLIKNLNQLV